ncbi:50S ribosomal protein L2 chloroplastic [Bienertia sinuspersici]
MGPIMGHTMHYRPCSLRGIISARHRGVGYKRLYQVPVKKGSAFDRYALGTTIHNIEITLGNKGEVHLISKNFLSIARKVGNVAVNQKRLGRTGSKRWLGKRPIIRGVFMKLIDHPHGGGEERAQLVEKTPQPLWVILYLEEEVEKGINSENSIICRHTNHLLRKIEKLKTEAEKEIVVTCSRESTIIPIMIGHTISIHNGREHLPICITDRMVGRKLGEFTLTLNLAHK